MKIYDGGRAANPRRVQIFLAEKGIEVPVEQVDINALEQQGEVLTKLNPVQRLPVLVLDDGTVISESIAICRYFDELHPDPPMFGRNHLERAMVEMWQRRVELHFLLPVAFSFRHLHPGAAHLEVPQVAKWGTVNQERAVDFMRILDTHLADNQFMAGEIFTVADITGIVTCQFLKPARITIPEELTNLHRWFGEMLERPSTAF